MADVARAQQDTAPFWLPQTISFGNIFTKASRGDEKLRTRAREEEKGHRGAGHMAVAMAELR
jgi:hypothetical protein